MPNIAKLQEVFAKLVEFVELPSNNFDYSGWSDSAEAVTELNTIRHSLSDGKVPSVEMRVLFLPTGPLQELSISSGWGNEFLQIADRFDEAMDEKDGKVCRCKENARAELVVIDDLGMDDHFVQVRIEQCPECGAFWLRYQYEHQALPDLDRWYRGELTESQCESLTGENAKTTLEALPWYFFGGRYYHDSTAKSSGSIRL